MSKYWELHQLYTIVVSCNDCVSSLPDDADGTRVLTQPHYFDRQRQPDIPDHEVGAAGRDHHVVGQHDQASGQQVSASVDTVQEMTLYNVTSAPFVTLLCYT